MTFDVLHAELRPRCVALCMMFGDWGKKIHVPWCMVEMVLFLLGVVDRGKGEGWIEGRKREIRGKFSQ